MEWDGHAYVYGPPHDEGLAEDSPSVPLENNKLDYYNPPGQLISPLFLFPPHTCEASVLPTFESSVHSHKPKRSFRKSHFVSNAFFEALVPTNLISTIRPISTVTPLPSSSMSLPKGYPNFDNDAPAPYGIGHPYTQEPELCFWPYHYPYLPPPQYPSGEVIESHEVTVKHSRESSKKDSGYYADPYNLTARHYRVEGGGEIRTQEYHICAVCRRPRSARYHRDHPLVPGQQIIPEVCRRCRIAESSSDDNKIVVNRPGRRTVRETERIRILSLSSDDERGRSSFQKKGDSNKTRSVKRRGTSSSRTMMSIYETKDGLESPYRSHSVCKSNEPAKVVTSMRRRDSRADSPSTERSSSSEQRVSSEQTRWSITSRSSKPMPARGHIMSSAESRLASHPSPFRHGYLISVPDKSSASSSLSNSLTPAIEPPPSYSLSGVLRKDTSSSRYAALSTKTEPACSRGRASPTDTVSSGRHSTLYREILRPLSRSRARDVSSWERKHQDRESLESAHIEVGGHHVRFAPVPKSLEGSNSPSISSSEPKQSRTRQRYRAGVDRDVGNESSRLPASRLSKYQYWQEPPRNNFPPYPEEPEEKKTLAPISRVVRKHSANRSPGARLGVRYVARPDLSMYAREPTPPEAPSPPAPAATLYDYAGRRTVLHPSRSSKTENKTATVDEIPLVQDSANTDTIRESYEMVDLRDIEDIDEHGCSVRVREIEETHYPERRRKADSERTRVAGG